MCFSSFCTDKQSFSCLMQVAIIEVSCCQPFFQEHCLESHPAILEQQTQINRNVWATIISTWHKSRGKGGNEGHINVTTLKNITGLESGLYLKLFLREKSWFLISFHYILARISFFPPDFLLFQFAVVSICCSYRV